MRATIAMQQGAAGGGANAELGQRISEQVQEEVEAAVAQAQEAQEAQAAAAAAGAQGAGAAQGEPAVRIAGDDGVIVIRDKATGEEVIIQRDAIPPWIQDGPPAGVFMVPIALFASIAFVVVGLPIARAFARRMDGKHAATPAVAPAAELRQLQTSIDTMAVEIERISENQRFLTRVLSDGRAAEPLPVRDGSTATPR